MPEVQKLFRNEDGDVQEMLSSYEGYAFKESPLDFFILLARYKFAARLLNKHLSVIDVGCGLGLGTVLLSHFAKQVKGVDVDVDHVQRNIEEHSEIKNLSFSTLDLLSPCDEHLGAYDAVVSMDVIEHFSEEDIPQVVANYERLLKPDGFAVIGTPNVASREFASERRLSTHPFEFSHDEFRSALSRSFRHVFIFSMTDEIVSTQFPGLSWYLMALCAK